MEVYPNQQQRGAQYQQQQQLYEQQQQSLAVQHQQQQHQYDPQHQQPRPQQSQALHPPFPHQLQQSSSILPSAPHPAFATTPSNVYPTLTRPPDSGAFVTSADPTLKPLDASLSRCRLDGLTIPATGPLRPPPINTTRLHPTTRANSEVTTPTTPTGTKLSADASEFVCFAVHRIWHRISYQTPPPPTQQQPASTIPAANGIPTASFNPSTAPSISDTGLVSPPGTSAWYPSFVKAVHNLITRASCTLPHILISLLYVTRLRNAIPSTHTGEGSEFRVFVSSLILAQKYHTDERFANKTWANMTGLPLRDINTMEREFLTGVGGRLHVTREDYERWLRSVQALGQEHSQVVKRARLEHALSLLKEQGDQQGLTEADLLRRVRTVPERDKVSAVENMVVTSWEA
ncbi:hypothetical protein HKX48_003518 [Thoreauomyces humboldtii]|nr:hypothetical protein HKX48_003518 [Thoreauomyces humboldtii]